MTPSRAEVQRDAVTPALDADSLVSAGVLTVAFDATNAAPQGLIENDGSIGGYYADVAAALAQRLGLSLALVDDAGASRVLEDGEADLFLGAAPSVERDGISVVGDCLEDASAVFVPHDRAATLTADFLSALTVGVQDSSAAQDALAQAGITAEQKTFLNINECFEALDAGEVDCVACDATSGSYLARAYTDVAFAGTLDGVTSYGAAAADAQVIEQVEAALEALAADGTLDAVHAAWYGTLPLSLTGTTLSGVTVSSSDTDTGSTSGSGSAPDTDSLVIEGDINDLID